MNLSRVIGPAIGGIAYAKVGASWVFLGNALTYFFIIGALLMVKLPRGRHAVATRPGACGASSKGSRSRPTTGSSGVASRRW